MVLDFFAFCVDVWVRSCISVSGLPPLTGGLKGVDPPTLTLPASREGTDCGYAALG